MESNCKRVDGVPTELPTDAEGFSPAVRWCRFCTRSLVSGLFDCNSALTSAARVRPRVPTRFHSGSKFAKNFLPTLSEAQQPCRVGAIGGGQVRGYLMVADWRRLLQLPQQEVTGISVAASLAQRTGAAGTPAAGQCKRPCQKRAIID